MQSTGDELEWFTTIYHPEFGDKLAQQEELTAIYESCQWWTLRLRTYLGDSKADTFPLVVKEMRSALSAFYESTLLQPRQVEEALHSFETWVSSASAHQDEVMAELSNAIASESLFYEKKARQEEQRRDPLLALELPKFENDGDPHWELPF